MRILLKYCENAYDLVNYTELTTSKSELDNSPELANKMVYLDVENAIKETPYITFNTEDMLVTSALKNIRSCNTVFIYDDISGFYYCATIIRSIYINNTTLNMELGILPIQTNFLNGTGRTYDCKFTKTPTVPVYTNNIAQEMVGETITSVQYQSSVSYGLQTLQELPTIMLVISKSLVPLGIPNKSMNPVIPSAETVLSGPLAACATKVGGTTVPGFVCFFSSHDTMQVFVDSCYQADIKVRCPVFGADGRTYQTPKNIGNGSTAGNGVFLPVAKGSDLEPIALSAGAAILNAENIVNYYVPEMISPSDFIMCKEIPYQLTVVEEPFVIELSLPILITPDSYFNLPSLLQIKCVSSAGESLTLDGSNVLFNDGTEIDGFYCRLIASLTGISLYIGDSSYCINVCSFPDVSYTGNSFENLNASTLRSSSTSRATDIAKHTTSRFFDKFANTVSNLFGGSDVIDTKRYEPTSLDKTTVLAPIPSSAWTEARLHIETTYVPPAVRSRLNAVFNRFGYDDNVFKTININSIENGFWMAAIVQEVNPDGLALVDYINSDISNGIKEQLTGGIYVKQ